MGDGKLGLKEVVAMGVGGMVSGGIYAVLGVAMKQAGNAVPVSYILAGAITLLTAYSYIKLTLYYGENGGAFSFIEHAVDNSHVAGFFGWVLVTGYVGVMAMYAFAFGAFLLEGLRATTPLIYPAVVRPMLSISIVALIVGVNMAGVKLSGLYEDVMVYIKIIILLSLAVLGIVFFDGNPLSLNFFDKGLVSPVAGFAIIFVSYEGFQLLTYDYNDIADVERNLKLGMYTAIILAILIYVSVSFMATLQLTPQQLIQHSEVALAAAVSNIPLLGRIGFALVIVSAIKSTSSGINATLFGTSRLAHRIATEKEMPRVFSFRNQEGIPIYALLIMGTATAVFAALGSLEQITEFGSVAFLIADSAANFANLRLYEETGSHPLIPAVGLLGTLVALPIVVWHLFTTEPHILASIAAIFAVLLVIEFIHMERETMEWVANGVAADVEEVEEEIEEEVEKLAHDEPAEQVDS
ncbi:MAG: APC family permease [Candidatus Nanohaloarchaea archaeon]